MNLHVDIEVASDGDDVPDPDSMIDWLRTALSNQSILQRDTQLREAAGSNQEIELSVRIVNGDEIQQLNNTYRRKNYTTNVLSFPSDLPPGVPIRHLGDIVVCAAVVNEEARQQNKAHAAHWAHMLVHGVLHLLGYDHETDNDADLMEALETEILLSMNFPAPYFQEMNVEEMNVEEMSVEEMNTEAMKAEKTSPAREAVNNQ